MTKEELDKLRDEMAKDFANRYAGFQREKSRDWHNSRIHFATRFDRARAILEKEIERLKDEREGK